MERNVFTKLSKIFNVCLIILRTAEITGVILYGFLDLIEMCFRSTVDSSFDSVPNYGHFKKD